MSNPNLSVTISAETAQLNHALAQLTARLDVLKSHTNATSKDMKDGFGAALDGMAAKLAALYAVAQVKAQFDGVLKLSGDVKLISEQMGIGANQAGIYALTLNRVGSDASGLLGITAKLTARITKDREAFASYGIEVAQGGRLRDSVQVLQDIVKKYDAIEGSAAKAQFGNKMLGKSFMESLPMLREFYEHMDATNELMKRFGVDMDFGRLKDMAEANEIQWTNFTTILNVLKMKVTSEVLPALSSIAANMTNTLGPRINGIITLIQNLTLAWSNGMTKAVLTTGFLAAAIRALTIAIATNPIMVAVAGIAAVVTGLAMAIDYMATSQERATIAQQAYSEKLGGARQQLADAKKSLGDYAVTLAGLEKQLKGNAEGTKKHTDAQRDLDAIAQKLVGIYPELNGYLKTENGHVNNLTDSLRKLNEQKERQFAENEKLLQQNIQKTEVSSTEKFTKAAAYDKKESADYGVERAYTDDGSLTGKGLGIMSDLGRGMSVSEISQGRRASTILVELIKDNAIAYKAYLEAKGAAVKDSSAASSAPKQDGGADKDTDSKFSDRLEAAILKAVTGAVDAATRDGLLSVDKQGPREKVLRGALDGTGPVVAKSPEDRQAVRTKLNEQELKTSEQIMEVNRKTLEGKIQQARTLREQIAGMELLLSKEGDPVKRVDTEAKLAKLKGEQLQVDRDIQAIQERAQRNPRNLDMEAATIKAAAEAGAISAAEELELTHKILLERLRIRDIELQHEIDNEPDPKKRAELEAKKPELQKERATTEAQYSIEKDKNALKTGQFTFKSFFTSIKNELKNSRNQWADWHDFVGGTLGSVHSAMSRSLSSMLQGNMTFSEGMKSAWMSVSSSAMDALSDMMMKIMEAQLVELLFGETKVAVTAEGIAADQAAMASTTAKTAVDTTETSTGIAAAISKIFSAHASIPFVGPLIAIGLIALMMSAFKSNTATARAKGGIAGLHGPEQTILGDGGEPEWVLPERTFKDEFGAYTDRLLHEKVRSNPGSFAPVSAKGIKAKGDVVINVPNGFVGDRVALGKFLSQILNDKALRG